MKLKSVGIFMLACLLFLGNSRADDGPTGIKVVENISVVRGIVNGKPVAWFNDGQLYAIYMNMKLPKAAELKKSLLAALDKNEKLRESLLFSPFMPAEQAPALIEVAIGREVPKEVVHALLGELGKRVDLKLVLSIVSQDGQGLATHEVYVGGLVKSGKKPITAERLKALLEPKLTQAELLEMIQSPDEKLFEIEKTEIVKEAVEVRGCRVEPNPGHVLFVCDVQFTKGGLAFSKADFAKLDVSKVSKEHAKVHGPVIAYGDFRLRLEDKSLVPCSCLPQSEEQPGPKVRLDAVNGEDDWLMYVGAVQLLAEVKPNAKPVALIWGGKYEVTLPAK